MLLVRHGETAWNLERRYQGSGDSPLTERGIAQARAFGRRLRALPEAASAAIVASPLGRARRTAEIIARELDSRALPRREDDLRLDDRLREISIGSWDGLTRDEIAARSPGIYDGDGRYEWYYRSPDGETYDALAARIAAFLAEAAQAPALIVVTHGVVSRVLRGLYARLPRAEALALPAPQDRIFRLEDGRIEEIPA
jgi:probable phosphoglycerate mutase